MRRLIAIVALLASSRVAQAYSVLTHEAVIDAAWAQYMTPILLARFPAATPDDLHNAHAYAYGGCIIQDMGYYPFGSHQFSNLTHYVRSGDFIEALLREAQNVNELAFALGALAHYAGDNNGHPLAVNAAVAILYPHLRAKYGQRVTYEEDPAAHLKTEFSFDVVQVANHLYAPEAYHDLIGFQVAKPVLDRAFFDVYGLHLSDVFSDLDLALGTYRHSVASILPTLTKAAWAAKKKDIIAATPGMTRRRFVFILSRSSYRKQWDARWERPGFWAELWAFIFKLIPKVGPLRAFAFKAPTPQTEQLFMKSFDVTFTRYRSLLAEVKGNRLHLANDNLDVGTVTAAAKYNLADLAYATLLDKLSQTQYAGITPALRDNILAYYADLSRPYATKRKRKKWAGTLVELQALRNMTGTTPAAR